MEEFGRIQFDSDILNSLKFYCMLGIHLACEGVPESIASKSLRSFIKDLKDDGVFKHHEVQARYLEAAYKAIPSSFFKLHKIEDLIKDGIRTIDVNYAWVNKL